MTSEPIGRFDGADEVRRGVFVVRGSLYRPSAFLGDFVLCDRFDEARRVSLGVSLEQAWNAMVKWRANARDMDGVMDWLGVEEDSE